LEFRWRNVISLGEDAPEGDPHAELRLLARSLTLFTVAGVCEIGGGWLMWRRLKDGKPGWWGLLGGSILVLLSFH